MKILIRLVLIFLVLGLASSLLIRVPAVQDRILVSAITALGSASNNLPEEDALSAAVCGSRSPLPSPGRAETCILVAAGEDLFVVDIGDGSNQNLRSWNINYRNIKAVLISHLHSDHIADLPGLHQNAWVLGRRSSKLKVYGPEGVDQLTQGIEQAYSNDYLFRNEHHGDDIAPLEFAGFDTNVIDLDNPVVFDNGDLKITAFKVVHEPVEPALGYKFEYKGRSLVITGDTSFAQSVVDISMDADVLFHEAQANHMLSVIEEAQKSRGMHLNAKVLDDITTYHTTLVEAAEIANRANVKNLVFYHLTPAPRNSIQELMFVRGVDKVRKEWTLVEDGTLIVLPVGSDEVTVANM